MRSVNLRVIRRHEDDVEYLISSDTDKTTIHTESNSKESSILRESRGDTWDDLVPGNILKTTPLPMTGVEHLPRLSRHLAKRVSERAHHVLRPVSHAVRIEVFE